MSFRTRRFVRPDSYVGYLSVDSCVSLFVGTSSRIAFVCQNCLSETEFEKGAVLNEFRRFSN